MHTGAFTTVPQCPYRSPGLAHLWQLGRRDGKVGHWAAHQHRLNRNANEAYTRGYKIGSTERP